jgi:hypothetical protein
MHPLFADPSLLHVICIYADDPTLSACLIVSRLWFEAAGSVLYKELHLTEGSSQSVLLGSHVISQIHTRRRTSINTKRQLLQYTTKINWYPWYSHRKDGGGKSWIITPQMFPNIHSVVVHESPRRVWARRDFSCIRWTLQPINVIFRAGVTTRTAPLEALDLLAKAQSLTLVARWVQVLNHGTPNYRDAPVLPHIDGKTIRILYAGVSRSAPSGETRQAENIRMGHYPMNAELLPPYEVPKTYEQVVDILADTCRERLAKYEVYFLGEMPFFTPDVCHKLWHDIEAVQADVRAAILRKYPKSLANVFVKTRAMYFAEGRFDEVSVEHLQIIRDVDDRPSVEA